MPGADRYRIYEGTFVLRTGALFRDCRRRRRPSVFTGEGLQWGTPPATGRVWCVKNLLEFKNAQRVVVDGNVFEHIWPHAQTGYAILLTPRNQESTAPWSAVRDITLANNVLRHMSGGISILGEDDEASSERTERITIRNNLVYDMSGQWGGDSHFLVMTRSPLNVKIDHNTIIHDGVVVLVDDGQSYGFEFTNNVTPHNIYGIFGGAAGTGTDAMAAYFPDGIVRRNAFGGGPAGQYPADNFFPSLSTFYAQFVDAGAHDYRLVSSSSFAGAATDGRNLGVDFNELGRAMQGVDNSGDLAPDPPPSGGAFGGSPVSLPGVLQAENFDEGGSGVAYADTTSGNEGGELRATDVDIESTADAGGGYNVGWISPGEWLSYTVNVVTAGSYTLRIQGRVAQRGSHLSSRGGRRQQDWDADRAQDRRMAELGHGHQDERFAQCWSTAMARRVRHGRRGRRRGRELQLSSGLRRRKRRRLRIVAVRRRRALASRHSAGGRLRRRWPWRCLRRHVGRQFRR